MRRYLARGYTFIAARGDFPRGDTGHRAFVKSLTRRRGNRENVDDLFP